MDKLNGRNGRHTNFQRLWPSAFQVAKKNILCTSRLQNLEGYLALLPTNGQILKHEFSYLSLWKLACRLYFLVVFVYNSIYSFCFNALLWNFFFFID